MKIHSILLSGLLAMHAVAAVDGNHGRYYAELQALKEAPETKMMFDEDTNQTLAQIQSSALMGKKLSLFDQVIHSYMLTKDVILVTPEIMPSLYEYVENVCTKADMKVPFIFVSRKKFIDNSWEKELNGESTFSKLFKNQRKQFNAFALKLLMTRGAVILDQKAIHELSDDALEALITHEIGHIKHNHNNKIICVKIIRSMLISLVMSNSQVVNNLFTSYPEDTELDGIGKTILYNLVIFGIEGLIINKRFEKEADAFAYADNGKAEGLIKFLELVLQNEELAKEEFATIYELLQENKASLSYLDYYGLLLRYYIEKGCYKFAELYKKVLGETILGTHPTRQARIAAVREYLAQQQQ